MARIKVDLHDIYNNSGAIDRALQKAFEDANGTKIREVEIIPGKGSGCRIELPNVQECDATEAQ